MSRISVWARVCRFSFKNSYYIQLFYNTMSRWLQSVSFPYFSNRRNCFLVSTAFPHFCCHQVSSLFDYVTTTCPLFELWGRADVIAYLQPIPGLKLCGPSYPCGMVRITRRTSLSNIIFPPVAIEYGPQDQITKSKRKPSDRSRHPPSRSLPTYVYFPISVHAVQRLL
jgi:hypothetical protein